MIVKENILFQRGLDPKKALDVGVRQLTKTKEGLAKAFYEQFKDYVHPDVYVYEFRGIMDQVYYYSPGKLDTLHGKYYRDMDKEYELDEKISKWFEEYTDYRVKSHSIQQLGKSLSSMYKGRSVDFWAYSVMLREKNKI